MDIQPNTFEAYKLLHDGSLALADAEEHGLKIDIPYCRKQKKILKDEIEKQEKELHKTKEIKLWKSVFKSKFNMDSNQQLAEILYDHLKYKEPEGRRSVDQAALEQIDNPMIEKIIDIRRLKKTRETYLSNYISESVDGVLHPFFHLHTTRTFRSSSSAINFQNQPVRIPMIKKLVRNAIIPRKGYMIAEIDYSGAEVRVACCYHKDPNMIADIVEPGKDMHRDMAAECYKLSKKNVTKEARYCGKNCFVFPQFYGDYYGNNARALWSSMHKLKLKTMDGKPMLDHLKSKKIGTPASFEKHIKEVERYFWEERYPIYGAWKKEHYKRYLKNGFISLYTGFICHGPMSKNDAINYIVQGAAFHCLLWSLIQLNNWLKQNKLKTHIIGQIHDSIVMEIWPDEVNEVFAMAHNFMTKKIANHWKWLNVPLEVEFELSPVNNSWYYKDEVIQTDFECDCGCYWFYDKKEDGFECPVCSCQYEK